MLTFWKIWSLTGTLAELFSVITRRTTLSQTYEHLLRTLPPAQGLLLSAATFSLTAWLIPHWAFKDTKRDNDAFALFTGAILGGWSYLRR